MGQVQKVVVHLDLYLIIQIAVATNSYLMLYPKPGLERLIAENTALLNKVWDILCSIGNKSIENEGRVYGGGLKKIEPKELAKVPCQELDFLC